MTIFNRIGEGGLSVARTVFDRAPVVTPEEQQANAVRNYALTTGAFGQGITRGMRGLKAGLNNFGGTLAEVAGQQGIADQLYADALRQSQLSAAEAPNIPALEDVRDLASGARYVAGAVGSGLPYITPAVAATTGARMAGATLPQAAAAGAAANVPPMAGAVQERLRADPVTAQLSPLQRAGISVGEGIVGATLLEAAPAVMAGKATGAAASRGVGQDIGVAMGMEGLGEVGQERLGQVVQSTLNPERDTSGDNMALMDAGIQGAVGVAPFAVPHAYAAQGLAASQAPRDWIRERVARSQDIDYTTLHTPQSMPGGMTTEQKHEWIQKDDDVRNAAAERLAQKYTTDPETPTTLHNAAKKFLKNPRQTDSWKELYSAAKTDQRVSRVKEGLDNFGKAFKQRIDNGIASAKAAREARNNEQTPLVDDSFDSLMADKLYEHTGIVDSDELLNKIPQAVADMKQWVSNGFALKKGGDVVIPHGFDHAFKDPVAAATDAYDLMRKQGLIEVDPKRFEEAIAQIKANTEAKKDDGVIVEDNLLPTIQAQYKFSGADHVQIAREIRRMVATGKIDEQSLDTLFGKNKELVLDALDKNREKVHYAEDVENTPEDSGLSDDLDYGEKHSTNEYVPSVEFHGPYDSTSEGALNHAKALEGTLTTAYGRTVRRVGVVDMLREKYANEPEKFTKVLTDYIQKHQDKLTTDVERARPDEALNAKHFVLRSEDAGDKHEALDIKGSELNTITPDSANNVWAEKIGKNREYADVSHGKLFFERLKYDNKGAVDKETGEITPSVTEFATSTNKLIAHARKAVKEGSLSKGGQVEMLKAGIASMLTAKDADGRPVTSGRIGVVDQPGGKVRWLKDMNDLPGTLRLASAHTVDSVRGEENKARIEALKEQLRQHMDKNNVLPEDAPKLEAALKSDDETALRAVVDKVIQDTQYDERTKKTTGMSETEEMAAAEEERADNRVRTHDEATGEELHPRERAPELTVEQKASNYIQKVLREKGIPAFSALAKRMNPEQLATTRAALNKMIEQNPTDTRLKAAMSRLGTAETKLDQTVEKRFNEQAGEQISEADKAKIKADIERRLGKDIAVDFADKILNAKGKEISGEWQEGLIRISMRAENPEQVGAHESMHEFFSRLLNGDETAQRVKDILVKAASSAPVLRQIERLLDGHAAALKQIQDGAPHAAEERLAYMYQFWHAGLLTVGPETKTFFKKVADFLRRTIGRLSDDQKAERLLQAFEEGKTPTADAAAQVLAKNLEYRERLINRSFEVMKPVTSRIARFMLPSEAILMRSENPELQAILRDFKNPTGEGVAQSNIEAKGQKMAQYMNRFQALVGKFEEKDLELAGKYLREGKTPTDRVAKEIYDGIHNILQDMETYLRGAGVKRWNEETKKWEDFGHIENYFPQAYDVSKITKDSDGFAKALLDHHRAELEAIAKKANEEIANNVDTPASYAAAQNKNTGKPVSADDVATAITDRIIMSYGHRDLNESTAIVGYSPFMRAINRRSLDFLDQSKFHDWMNNDLTNVITSYIAQGVKRAEYVRRFDNGGEGLTARMEKAYEYEKARIQKDNPSMSVADVEAKALKELDGPAKAVMALEGTIGYDIDPRMRRLQGTIMAYENLRTMGLSLFSALIDPLGIMVRGGELQDAMAAYSRSLKEVWNSWKGVHTEDADAKLAEFLGTVDAGGFLANFGQAYSSMYLHEKVRKWNEGLFKWNGMDGFNRGVRIQATQAAIAFIKRQVTNPTEHSKRYLDELTLKSSDVKIDENGDLNYNDPKVQTAIKRWVDQAILRPNAAHRPTWMSDPHYAIFGHMKQFSYTFHDTIIKRAWNEAKEHQNLAPMGVLLGAFTPMMVAADVAKAILLTGKEPVWMHGGLPSMIDHGARRAGLLGLAQPYADPVLSGHPAGMGGPAVDQVVSALTQPFDETLVDALPGASVIHTMQGGNKLELMADD